jgi:hypothetical protein
VAYELAAEQFTSEELALCPLPRRRVMDTIHGLWRRAHYAEMVFKNLVTGTTSCVRRLPHAPRVSDQRDDFQASRAKIASFGVLTGKAVTHPYHIQRPHRR